MIYKIKDESTYIDLEHIVSIKEFNYDVTDYVPKDYVDKNCLACLLGFDAVPKYYDGKMIYYSPYSGLPFVIKEKKRAMMLKTASGEVWECLWDDDLMNEWLRIKGSAL